MNLNRLPEAAAKVKAAYIAPTLRMECVELEQGIASGSVSGATQEWESRTVEMEMEF